MKQHHTITQHGLEATDFGAVQNETGTLAGLDLKLLDVLYRGHVPIGLQRAAQLGTPLVFFATVAFRQRCSGGRR